MIVSQSLCFMIISATISSTKANTEFWCTRLMPPLVKPFLKQIQRLNTNRKLPCKSDRQVMKWKKSGASVQLYHRR